MFFDKDLSLILQAVWILGKVASESEAACEFLETGILRKLSVWMKTVMPKIPFYIERRSMVLKVLEKINWLLSNMIEYLEHDDMIEQACICWKTGDHSMNIVDTFGARNTELANTREVQHICWTIWSNTVRVSINNNLCSTVWMFQERGHRFEIF